ncbi:MAG TPA: hypothetical protein VIO35_09760 [Chloroflexota bacterium]
MGTEGTRPYRQTGLTMQPGGSGSYPAVPGVGITPNCWSFSFAPGFTRRRATAPHIDPALP